MDLISYPLNGITYGAEDVATYMCTRTSGIYSRESNFGLSITGAREVTISPGLAWINYDDFAGISVCAKQAGALTIPDADITLSRIDRVVLQFDVDANKTSLLLKTGRPSASPTAPAIIQTRRVYELGLYTISVPAGSTSVTSAHVTDTRLDESVCGVMRDGVTTIPTATLQAEARGRVAGLEESATASAAAAAQSAEAAAAAAETAAKDAAELAAAQAASEVYLAIMPVGYIYTSTDSTSPASLFGGTWERIKDRFLLAAGDSYTAGATGGEATHRLTVNEIANHSHTASTGSAGSHTHSTATEKYDSGTGSIRASTPNHNAGHSTATTNSAGAHTHTVTVNSTGGGGAHNNMPPYLVVYCWQRVA